MLQFEMIVLNRDTGHSTIETLYDLNKVLNTVANKVNLGYSVTIRPAKGVSKGGEKWK